jgi:hypothetical protein
MKRFAAGIVTAAVIAAGATACTDDALSSEALSERVTEICQATAQRHTEAADGFDWASFDPTTSDLGPIVELIEQSVAIASETADQLDKLRGSDADEALIAQWIAVNDEIAAGAQQMVESARSDDRETFMELGAAEDELHAKFPQERMFVGC